MHFRENHGIPKADNMYLLSVTSVMLSQNIIEINILYKYLKYTLQKFINMLMKNLDAFRQWKYMSMYTVGLYIVVFSLLNLNEKYFPYLNMQFDKFQMSHCNL